MANKGFLIDSNTFWMISGTSKMSLNLDPINGQIWTPGPHIYGFYCTKILQKKLESICGPPLKIFSSNNNSKVLSNKFKPIIINK